jgi:putative transposase
MKKLKKTYPTALCEEAVKLVLTQGLSIEQAAASVSIPKGTLANWVAAARRVSSEATPPGSRTVAELEAENARLRKELGVSRSGFYDWLHAKPSTRLQEDTRLKVLITAAHRQSRETYGTRRVKHELAAHGHDVGRDRVGRLRGELKLRCKQRRKFVATTNSRHDRLNPPNIAPTRTAIW